MSVKFTSKGLSMLLACTLSLSVPVTAYSQGSHQVRITMTVDKQPLQQVLETLGKKHGYQLFYNASLVKGIKVSANLKQADINQVMNRLLANTNLQYSIKGKTIVITSSSAKGQQGKTLLKGRVVDNTGVGLPGVNIYTKDRTQLAVTDLDGNFAFAKPLTRGVVVNFTSVGMKSQRITYNGESTLKIVMIEDVNELEDVVVTGVVNKMKNSFTGSAATFTGAQLKGVGTQNAIASLKTLDPSFNVLDSEFGSDPNRMPDIEIRGKSSLISTRDELAEDPNQPLFILDGFESSLEAIYNLDMNRIASITILKDAASTAIYGSKASNGVVVVETIKPKSGRLHLTYNGSANVQWADLTSYNLMNSAEKLEFEKLVGRYSNFSNTEQELRLMQSYNQKLSDIARGVDTYWLSEPLRTGLNHRHSVYAEGGEGAFMFGLGFSYNGVTGIMKDSKRDNISGNIDLTYRLNKLQFSNKFSLDNTDSQNPMVSFSEYAKANPYYMKYNEDGGVDRWLEYTDDIKASNPLYDASLNSYSKSGGFSLSDKFIAEYTPIHEMKIRARFGITHTNSESKNFYSPRSTAYYETEYTKRGSYSWGQTKTNKYEGELTLTYAKVLKDVHMFNLALGGYLSQTNSTYNGYSAVGFPMGDYDLPSFANGYPEGGKPGYSENISRSVSGYAIGSYSYDNRYLLDFSYRVNGSSVFGRNKHYIGTWAVGLAWNIHNEKFIKDNIDGISYLKLRASIGNPGNQNFSSSATLTTFRYNFNSFNYFGMSTSMAQLGNPNLEWQTTIDRNIGFDITILNDRLKLVGDYYYKTTDPLLITIDMPASSGATNNQIYKNFGKQTSKGFTGQATYYIIRQIKNRLWWNVRGTLRTGKTELSGIGNQLESFNSKEREGDNRSTKRYYDGASTDDIWVVRSAGIDPATGREIFIKKNGELTYDFSYDDEVIVGNSRPTIEGVLGTSFSWKGLSVSADFRYRVGGYSFNSVLFNKVENISTSSLIYNQDKRALYDRWQKPGDQAQFKDIANSVSTPMSSRFVQRDNSWSLESLRIGYEFSPELAHRFGMSSIRFNAYMNDIFRLTTIKQERGTSYPYARSVSFALSLTL